MSRSEPWAAGAAPEVGIPDFPIALRGYERQQVDAYILDLRTLLADERQRAKENAEAYAKLQQELATVRKQEPLSFDHLGTEAARVLEQAGLVSITMRGRERVYRLRADRLHAVAGGWLGRFG